MLAQLFGSVAITNGLNSTATSGDATVGSNTIGGSAKTGAAKVVTNLLNLLNSMWTWTSGGFNYFVHNIVGNQTGDINLTAADTAGGGGAVGSCSGELAGNTNTGSNSRNTATANCSNDVTVANKPTGSITNNVDVLAHSGNAKVDSNTTAGDATSGNARAEVNLVNLINSAIGAGQTFFGIFNIYGNLNGDILFPTLNLNGSVASSVPTNAVSNNVTGPNSSNTATANNSNAANITNAPNASISNNVRTAAVSGAAMTSDNNSAGNATTGQASTKTATFNLFDTSIFGDNAVLVIINDMGHWVGRLMNLGVGGSSGSGLLTSNATISTNSNTGPGSTNTANNSSSNSLNVINAPTETITNNIRAGAVSGDASVTNNTTAGSAKTGDATVSTNVANILGSHLSFKKIFGILIINVFGTWFGDVGQNTSAGDIPKSTVIGKGAGSPLTARGGGVDNLPVLSVSSIITSRPPSLPAPTLGGDMQVSGGGFVAGIDTAVEPTNVLSAIHGQSGTPVSPKSNSALFVISIIIMVIAGILAIIERRIKPV